MSADPGPVRATPPGVGLAGPGPVRFYVMDSDGGADPDALARARAASPAHEARLWRPGRGGMLPPLPDGAGKLTYLAYGLMNRLGLFANGDYGAMILRRPGEPPDHLSSVFPGFFRFPFMAPADLQIGMTTTVETARRQGLAWRAILEIVQALGRPGRRFWYLTEAGNAASCRVVEKAGFVLAGTGAKQPRLGTRALGYYAMTQQQR